MSQLTDRLSFLTEKWTADQIFNNTLITPREQDEILSGEYTPDAYERNALNSMFRSTTYSEARSIGYSSYEASRYSNYSINTQREMWNTVKGLQRDMADYSIRSQELRRGKNYSYTERSALLNERIDSIREGWRKSKKTIKEAIEDYNKRLGLTTDSIDDEDEEI